jgi:hypothetical protein
MDNWYSKHLFRCTSKKILADWYTLESEVTHNKNQKQLSVKYITCRSAEQNELTEEDKSS